MEERILLDRLLQKEEKALEELYRQYEAYVSSLIFQIIGLYMTKEDRMEVVNDTFYRLWENAEKIDLNKGTIKSYLTAIARNSGKNKLREFRGAEEPLQDKDYISIPGPAEKLEERERAEEVRKAISLLKPDVREIFLRYYYLYETTSQIAEKMGLRQNTVKSKLKRGRKQLEKILRERGMSL